jgi:hypothetical protein
MRARLAGLIAAVAVALAIAPIHPSGTVLAGPPCPAGTNWDNSMQACR